MQIIKFSEILKTIFYAFASRGLNWIPDKSFLELKYKYKKGKKINFLLPTSLSEKGLWLILYGELQKYTNLVDKYEVRKYISKKIGEEYLLPLIGVWDRFEDINFDYLPEQFVLKCTHDSGSVIICTDKKKFDRENAKKKINKCLKRNFYFISREPQYKNIKPRIICEKYMVDESGTELKDYKVFCFNGDPRIIQVDLGRFTNHKKNFYDTDWNLLPVAMDYPVEISKTIDKPKNLGEMLNVTKQLSDNIPFVRVDFYSIKDKIYFGELTFSPGTLLGKIEPEEFDLEMGNWLDIGI